ncbi:MAG: hypothetical protein RBR78_00255 [Flavobacteriaceae bacterium]|jgi:hypothetical protein|nr:hypothetical protein [Flavobacteriaceae bacterium]
MKERIIAIGMAKSSLKLKTAGVRKNLELDVLRMIYFINNGENIHGFLLVYNDEIKNLVIKWLKKYDFDKIDRFTIFTFSDTPTEKLNEMMKEKQDNASFKNSKADFSKEYTEKLLTDKVDNEFESRGFKKSNVSETTILNGINWDFYEVFEK